MYQVKEAAVQYKISNTPEEHLRKVGESKLSDQELLAILLKCPLEDATKILQEYESLENFRRVTLEELTVNHQLNFDDASKLLASIEFGKRINDAQRRRYGQIKGSNQFAQTLYAEMSHLDQEHLVAFYLDGKNRIIKKKTIFVGTVNTAPANPREILHHAVKLLAVGVIVVHNHPSGDFRPSGADDIFTDRIESACETLGISFVDHIIIGDNQYYSYAENSLLS